VQWLKQFEASLGKTFRILPSQPMAGPGGMHHSNVGKHKQENHSLNQEPVSKIANKKKD
jgi:hypothetical protein